MVSIISEWWIRLLLGLAGSFIISYVAYRLASLSRSGMLSAIVMGTGFIVFGEPIWFTLLLVFFISSTLWSKWKKSSQAKRRAEQVYEKGGRRDAGQVWANGGIGLLLCVLYFLTGQEALLYVYIGVMGAVTADTWATEIGALSKQPPRSIMTLQAVTTGTSGGVTSLGLIASLTGGLLIGIVAYVVSSITWHAIWIGAVTGLLGSLSDSFIGAKWQAMYRCEWCGKETERTVHCSKRTMPLRGLPWLNNDRVNMISSIVAGLIAYGLFWLIVW